MKSSPPDRIGIDLGGTKIEAVRLSPTGEIRYRHRCATPHGDYDRIIDVLTEVVEMAQLSFPDLEPATVGIGAPGAQSHKTGMIKNSNTTVINGKNLPEDLEQACGYPIRIANDADCFTLSEAIDGAGAGQAVVFGVILGTGVGGGICIDQKLTPGVNSIAGEWGHNPMPLDRLNSAITLPLTRGRDCYCGQRDCIETWLSGPGVAASYAEMTGKSLTAKQIFDPVGPKATTQMVFDIYCELAALALSTVINVIDPACIVLGGGVSNTDHLASAIQKRLLHYVFSDQVDTQVMAAHHGDASGVRGAAWLW